MICQKENILYYENDKNGCFSVSSRVLIKMFHGFELDSFFFIRQCMDLPDAFLMQKSHKNAECPVFQGTET